MRIYSYPLWHPGAEWVCTINPRSHEWGLPLLPPKTVFMKRHCFPASLVSVSAMLISMCQKKYRSSFYSRAIATIATICHQCYNVTMLQCYNVTMLQCYMLHVTLRKINFGHSRTQRIVYINNILFIYTILWLFFTPFPELQIPLT